MKLWHSLGMPPSSKGPYITHTLGMRDGVNAIAGAGGTRCPVGTVPGRTLRYTTTGKFVINAPVIKHMLCMISWTYFSLNVVISTLETT